MIKLFFSQINYFNIFNNYKIHLLKLLSYANLSRSLSLSMFSNYFLAYKYDLNFIYRIKKIEFYVIDIISYRG
jgi:hypothetical protein